MSADVQTFPQKKTKRRRGELKPEGDISINEHEPEYKNILAARVANGARTGVPAIVQIRRQIGD